MLYEQRTGFPAKMAFEQAWDDLCGPGVVEMGGAKKVFWKHPGAGRCGVMAREAWGAGHPADSGRVQVAICWLERPFVAAKGLKLKGPLPRAKNKSCACSHTMSLPIGQPPWCPHFGEKEMTLPVPHGEVPGGLSFQVSSSSRQSGLDRAVLVPCPLVDPGVLRDAAGSI